MPENNKKGVFLADGTRLNADAGYANENLWVWMNDNLLDLATVFRLFNDPQLTATIKYVITPEAVQQWNGFTKLTAIQVEDDLVRIRMRKG